MDAEIGRDAIEGLPTAVGAMLAHRVQQGPRYALVATPHRPLILGLRLSKAITSLSFAISGHFGS